MTIWCKVKASRYTAALLAGLIPSLAFAQATEVPPTPSPSRIIRVDPANVRVIDHLRLSTEELLDENFKFFDSSVMAVVDPHRLPSEIGRSQLYLEFVNTSKDTIMVDPNVTMAFFDGSTAIGLRHEWTMPSTIYPGERVPMIFTGERFNKITEIKADWQPAKPSALPGPRPKLKVTIEKTDAGIGSGTLNFTYRYQYKYVTVFGRVLNESQSDVDEIRVWVSLYDAKDHLTGARYEELRVPTLKPGESVPFQFDVKQHGANFARVAVIYDAEAQ